MTDPTEEEKVPRDFVFAGRRMSRDNTLADAIHVVLPDGTLDPDYRLYAKDKSMRVIGGVYTGAKFTASASYGISVATYKGRWQDATDIAGWQALDDEDKARYARRKLEADEKAQHVIADMLLPARMRMHELMKRGKVSEASAFEASVIRLLHKPPTEKEKAIAPTWP